MIHPSRVDDDCQAQFTAPSVRDFNFAWNFVRIDLGYSWLFPGLRQAPLRNKNSIKATKSGSSAMWPILLPGKSGTLS